MKEIISIFLYLFIAISCYANPFDIDSDQLKEKELLALKGDASSADDLSFFYTFSEDTADNENNKKINYWASIAAENDSTGRCQYNYYVLITSEPFKLDNFKRGLYWLYKSSEIGYKNAKDDVFFKKDSSDWFEFSNDILFKKQIENKKELSDYEEAAICGSGNAALNLYKYYLWNNDKSYNYWLRIGAQNGNKECMRKYAEFLRKSSDKYDNIRAEFWEKRSKT